MDTDNPEHIQWLYETALSRAAEFNITGVTYSLTQGVVKNIIPAIASTNAIIAASCCSEALKILTAMNPYLENYMMYTGDEGVYTHTFPHEKKEGCPVCGQTAIDFEVDPEISLEAFMELLKERPDVYVPSAPAFVPVAYTSYRQIKKPSLSTERRKLYFQGPPELRERTISNLDRKMRELVDDGEEVAITDPGLPFSLKLNMVFKK